MAQIERAAQRLNRAGETFAAFVGMLSTGVPADHLVLGEVCDFLQIGRHSAEA